MFYQKKFLTSLLTSLNDKTASQKVIEDLNSLRAFLLSSSNLAVHITADWNQLNDLHIDVNSPWQKGFDGASKT